jgi:hypothetical protein
MIHSTNIPIGHLTQCIRWISKRVHNIHALAGINVDGYRAVANVLERFVQMTKSKSGSLMRTIWKTLHPAMLQATDLRDIEQALLTWCSDRTSNNGMFIH